MPTAGHPGSLQHVAGDFARPLLEHAGVNRHGDLLHRASRQLPHRQHHSPVVVGSDGLDRRLVCHGSILSLVIGLRRKRSNSADPYAIHASIRVPLLTSSSITAWMLSRSTSTRVSTCSLVTIKGGEMPTVFPSALTMTPRIRQAAAIRLPIPTSGAKLFLLLRSMTNSTPARRPIPRTSPTIGRPSSSRRRC